MVNTLVDHKWNMANLEVSIWNDSILKHRRTYASVRTKFNRSDAEAHAIFQVHEALNLTEPDRPSFQNGHFEREGDSPGLRAQAWRVALSRILALPHAILD